jgi:hypothetical protein
MNLNRRAFLPAGIFGALAISALPQLGAAAEMTDGEKEM